MKRITNQRTLDIYNTLANYLKDRTYRYSRFDMVSFCIGYYGVVDNDITDAIMQLYLDDLIES